MPPYTIDVKCRVWYSSTAYFGYFDRLTVVLNWIFFLASNIAVVVYKLNLYLWFKECFKQV